MGSKRDLRAAIARLAEAFELASAAPSRVTQRALVDAALEAKQLHMEVALRSFERARRARVKADERKRKEQGHGR